jgi:hypothetical protein
MEALHKEELVKNKEKITLVSIYQIAKILKRNIHNH